MRALPLPTAALLALALAGCGPPATRPTFEAKTAVFGYLRVGEPVAGPAAILVTRTRPIEAPYDPAEAAVAGALVTLQADGAAAPDTLAMLAPGRYGDSTVVIAPRTTYRLTVRAGAETLTASTTTPAPISFLAGPLEVPGTMAHADIAGAWPIVVDGPDPEQVLSVDVYCLEDRQDATYVHPVAGHEVPKNDREYGGANGAPRHLFAYLRMGDLEPAPVGHRIGFYGDMMLFYGRYRVGVFALDANAYASLWRDHPELHGGVVGGIGVFGSLSGRTWMVQTVR